MAEIQALSLSKRVVLTNEKELAQFFNKSRCIIIFIQLKIHVMKRNLLLIAIIASIITIAFTACQTKSAATDQPPAIPAADTAGLAAYQEWKMQNERKSIEEYQKAAAPAPATVRTSAPKKQSSSQPVAAAPEQAKKKGWSKAAKGAVIGTATGATAGVLISKKNKALGGVIGGVVGGGLGYIIGRDMDKRDGRVK